MCGFIGQIVRDETGKSDLLRGLPWLRRRGPDSQKLWSSDDKRVTILHTRLTIVDSDVRAHQPLSDTETGVTIAFVGEIYNYLEVKRQLTGYRFVTDSDTEVILGAYVTYGIKGLSLLKGMFSLVIVDEKQKKVLLARDSIGKKPLFLAFWGDGVLFGISLLPLVAVSQKNIHLNDEVLGYFWKNAYIPPTTAILSGAIPVLPGQVLELDWSGNLLKKTTCDPEPLKLYEGEPLEEVIRIIHSLLSLAVQRRLSNNPKPIALLSGGIDSTIMSVVAKTLCQQMDLQSPFQILTLASFIPLMNDEFYARYAAHRIKIRMQLIKPSISIRRIGDLILKALDLQDEPLGMPSFFLLERLVNAASHYGRILFSGDGGDEVFLGYGKPADWYNGTGENGTHEKHVSCGPKIPSWMSPWARMMVTDSLVGHMLAKADRASAEQGVELRCPLLDWDLVSYVRSLPFEILVHGGRMKALLKDQLIDWPQWFLERPKVGFTYNLRWLWGLSNYAGLREAVDNRAVDTFGLYLPKVLRRKPVHWRTIDIFRHFEAAWRLLSWSRFLGRYDSAQKSE
jgi:asparagine synthase (glutamine-hydrolysing)